ncbi:Na+/H+ antiporter subunit E [Verticiella sediminum]|uniref:Na+/H+ antiporter subunit E n=1 Tax=Verticiella sediminum TaxID=1247510 RepID=A0A556ASB7_9BURK|nr:Na+/H+ antiporter subunit E [Verticiella sediminum]TSH95816.1 Na+/H+ antiporter subunit E [Verticiella sediminum]
MLKRWFPSPLLSLFLLALWLLLNQSLSLGHILLGALLAWYGPYATRKLRPTPVRVRAPLALVRLVGRVAVDIVTSNIAVAGVVLGKPERRQRSGFMKIPLDMHDSHGLAALASILTACPGTVWAGLNEETNVLTIHVLDLQDEGEWVDIVKNRYEKLLMEIFE